MHTFLLWRDIEQGQRVAEGCEFTDGTVVLRWLKFPFGTHLFASMADMLTIHGHPGTKLVNLERLGKKYPHKDSENE